MLQPTRKVTPFLWFDTQAEEAARFYVSLFPTGRVVSVPHWGGGSPYPEGSVMSVTFEIDGCEVIAFNGGPHFQLNEACSLFVSCDDQAEVDRLWSALTADGGTESRCGWLKDKFGLSWQIAPKILLQLIGDPDRTRSTRAMQSMMTMSKIDIATLQRAADGR